MLDFLNFKNKTNITFPIVIRNTEEPTKYYAIWDYDFAALDRSDLNRLIFAKDGEALSVPFNSEVVDKVEPDFFSVTLLGCDDNVTVSEHESIYK